MPMLLRVSALTSVTFGSVALTQVLILFSSFTHPSLPRGGSFCDKPYIQVT